MAKTISRKKTSAKEPSFSFSNIIPEKYHVLASIIVTIVLFLIYFFPLYFGGKAYQSSDILTAEAMIPYIKNHVDGFTLWNPFIFCGMPAYGLGTSFLWFNIIYVIFTGIKIAFGSLFAIEYARWTLYLIILAVSTFFLVRYLTKNTWVGLLSGLAAAFSTGIIVFLYIGHVTKLTSLCFYPLLLLILLRFQQKIKLLDFLFLVIVLQLFIQGFHVQIIFYILFTIAIYYIYYFFRYLVIKDSAARNRLIKSALVFMGAAVIAILIQADNLTQINEYTPVSTRGSKGIVELSSGKQSAETKGSSDFYNYHTSWSFSPGEVMTFIVPSYYGFGKSNYNGPITNGPYQLNSYFGQMPFVDVAMYMGVIIFLLGLFAVFTRWKEPFVRFLAITSFIALVISFGKNFPVLFDLMFNYFPGFDKFRVPSMFLVIVQLNFPILAGLGVWKIITLKDENNVKLINAVKYLAFGFTGLFLLFAVLSSAVTSWFGGRITEFVATLPQNSNQGQVLNAFKDHISNMFLGDLLIAMALMAAVFWCAYLYINNKLSKDLFVGALIIFIIFDLWRIDSRGEDMIDNPEMKGNFDTPNYVQVIKNQKDKDPFRILNLKQDGTIGSYSSNANHNAYFLLEDFYGYSGIKPRTYQDLLDVVNISNPTLWRLANVKYIVLDKLYNVPGLEPIYQGEKEVVYKNNNALPRAFFVDQVEQKSNIEMLNSLRDNAVDPGKVAFVEKPLKVDVPDSNASVKITDYGYEKISMDVKASGNNFLFFGNTFMAGTVKYLFFSLPTGWKAEVDGKQTEIYKTDHGFMGIVVPAGSHKVQFLYAPPSFFISKWIVLILSTLVVLSAILLLIFRKKKEALM